MKEDAGEGGVCWCCCFSVGGWCVGLFCICVSGVTIGIDCVLALRCCRSRKDGEGEGSRRMFDTGPKNKESNY